MLFLKKYILLFFLIENIMAQTQLIGELSQYLFYPFMCVGLYAFFTTEFWNKQTIGKFHALYCLMLVYIIYEFSFGIEYLNSKTLLYLIGKLSTFGIIILSLANNERYYRTNAIFLLIVFSCSFLLYGLLTGGHQGGRALAGYTNANTAGAIGALSVGMLIFYMRDKRWKWFPPGLILLIGFYGVLAGGSRAGFLMLFMLVFLRFGFNIRTFALGAILIALGLYLLPAIGVKTVGIERMVNTYKGIEKSNRNTERFATELMIAEKPWIGWGYEAENQGEAAKITKLGSHNGYLETIKQMGYPCAIIFFGIILLKILEYLSLWHKKRFSIDLFFALTVILMVNANYESLFVGVHEYVTNIFFFALAMVSADIYYLKHKHLKK